MASKTTDAQVGDQGVLVIGLIVGLFAIGPVARAAPTLVNGFLILVLFSSLLYHRDRWLPYLERFAQAA
jgi:hypothetical protein